jgi:recombinational DNA repair ATPase RecF
MSVDRVTIFNEKVNLFNGASSDRSFFLDNERYDKVLWDVKEAEIL